MPIDRDALIAEGPDLYRFALSITRNPDSASDLVQDTYIRVLESEGRFREGARLGPWMRRILHNLAVDRSRRAARELMVEEVEDLWREDSYTIDPSVAAERGQTREELEDALTRLPFIYRTVVVLHDVDGWTVARIAELQGISLSAAKQRLRRGRMALTSAIASGAERRRRLEGVPMPCWDARRHISDYLNGDLDGPTIAVVESHLEACPTCPPLVAALVGAHDRLGTLRDPDTVIPSDLEHRIRMSIAGEEPRSGAEGLAQ